MKHWHCGCSGDQSELCLWKKFLVLVSNLWVLNLVERNKLNRDMRLFYSLLLYHLHKVSAHVQMQRPCLDRHQNCVRKTGLLLISLRQPTPSMLWSTFKWLVWFFKIKNAEIIPLFIGHLSLKTLIKILTTPEGTQELNEQTCIYKILNTSIRGRR